MDNDDERGNMVLPPPSEAALQRARPLFDKLVKQIRDHSEPAPAPPPTTGDGPPRSFGGGRRYTLALSLLPTDPALPLEVAAQPSGMASAAPAAHKEHAQGDPPSRRAVPLRPRLPPIQGSPRSAPSLLPDPDLLPDLPMQLPDSEVTEASVDSLLEPTVLASLPSDVTLPGRSKAPSQLPSTMSLPPRPPAGAAAVRQGIARPQNAAPVADALLAQTAETAMLRTEPDGAMSFDIAFRDEVFTDMACTVSVKAGRAVATFRVSDDNTRRLLEAESGKLRLGLEARGLKVDRVLVLKA